MISQIDIQKISDLPIEQVADALGLTVKRHWSLCPFHSDSKPSLYYRVAKNKYRCYVCDHYGGPIDLTMEIMRLNFHDAVCWLAKTFGISIEDSIPSEFRNIKPRKVQPVRKEIVNPFDPSSLAQLVAEPILTEEARHFLFEERKLDPRVIQWCGVSSTHNDLNAESPRELIAPEGFLAFCISPFTDRQICHAPDFPNVQFPKFPDFPRIGPTSTTQTASIASGTS